MKTNLDIITAAMQQLGILAETQSASAEQAALGLTVLNEMLEEWGADGVDVGQWPQSDLSAEFPGSPSVEPAVKANLAIWLSPYYERDVRPAVIAIASAGYSRLKRDAIVAKMETASMSHLPKSQAHWDIEAG